MATGAREVAQMVATPPPRTRDPGLLGFSKAQNFQPPELAALEEDKPLGGPQDGDLARAVLAQSQALTALVGQIAQSSQAPMMDLGAASSGASTRGALGRAKLQAELASHSGTFFMAVLRAMARRMQPTSATTGSAEDLMRRGVSGTLGTWV